jgi:hypothetical protein
MSIEEQGKLAAEAWRRANPNGDVPEGAPPNDFAAANAGLRATDMWSSGGQAGVVTPDLQGPVKPLAYPDATELAPNERPTNPIPGAARVENRER